MKKIKYLFNTKQLIFLKEIGVELKDREYSSDERVEMIEKIEDLFQEKGIYKGQEVNEFGKKCVDLLDVFGNM